MTVNLEVMYAHQYFEKQGEEIDWDETGKESTISIAQYNILNHIITCEISIFLLRGAYGFDGGAADDMASIRREFIDKYEKEYEPYVEYNDYY